MKEKQPLLSICLPTYNRGYILRETLQKFVSNQELNDDVELIISDNCSTDDTQEICLHFASLHHSVKYHRNEENIHDRNFVKVLSYANGLYLKLINDWTYYDEDGLHFVKEKVKMYAEEKIPLFFTTGVLFTKRKAEYVRCNNLDDYIATVSTFVTYNNIFGVWKEQWELVEDKQRYAALKLQQVDWTYQIVLKNGGCVIFDKQVMKYSSVERKTVGGYNWFGVHLDNYYTIMDPYIRKGYVTKKTFVEDKHYLLKHFKTEFCYTFFYNFDKTWKFETKGTLALLWKYYKHDPYMILYSLMLPFTYLTRILKYYRRKRHQQ